MHERSLPPSPNWYCSRCSDLNSDGLLGFGGKNIIYLIDVSASSCRVVGEYTINGAHYIKRTRQQLRIYQSFCPVLVITSPVAL